MHAIIRHIINDYSTSISEDHRWKTKNRQRKFPGNRTNSRKDSETEVRCAEIVLFPKAKSVAM